MSRYLSLRISSNVLLINLCVAGLVMLSPAPVFFINLHHGGPYLGETGAKVDQLCKQISFSVWETIDFLEQCY